MKGLQDLEQGRLDQVRYILTDVDDTITTSGKLYPQALEALWALSRAGYLIIPVTGGSAGWADIYLRQWPIDAVITESGALAYYLEEGRRRTFCHPSIEQEGYGHRAEQFMRQVLKEVPGSKLSSDQFCRIYDMAFDHHGEQPFMTDEAIAAVTGICTREQVTFGVSSIHVNCWFGSYDKLSMVELFMNSRYALSREQLHEQAIYCGDSSNDIPLFRAFPLSFGVGSIAGAGWAAADEPAYCAREAGGAGFAQIAQLLLQQAR
ncbi:MAG: HAD-IIB family hydrolase [Spirochaetia bacterium]|nr:HAD-IIB family hydrolase [Spirochaetia bacterium]